MAKQFSRPLSVGDRVKVSRRASAHWVLGGRTGRITRTDGATYEVLFPATKRDPMATQWFIRSDLVPA